MAKKRLNYAVGNALKNNGAILLNNSCELIVDPLDNIIGHNDLLELIGYNKGRLIKQHTLYQRIKGQQIRLPVRYQIRPDECYYHSLLIPKGSVISESRFRTDIWYSPNKSLSGTRWVEVGSTPESQVNSRLSQDYTYLENMYLVITCPFDWNRYSMYMLFEYFGMTKNNKLIKPNEWVYPVGEIYKDIRPVKEARRYEVVIPAGTKYCMVEPYNKHLHTRAIKIVQCVNEWMRGLHFEYQDGQLGDKPCLN